MPGARLGLASTIENCSNLDDSMLRLLTQKSNAFRLKALKGASLLHSYICEVVG